MQAFERQLTWLNEPPTYGIKDAWLEVVTGDRTDFWRGTFYNFWRDNGHFLHEQVEGDFTAEVTIQGRTTRFTTRLVLWSA